MHINFLANPKKRLHHYFIPVPENDHRPHLMRHRALHFYSSLLIGVKVFLLIFLFTTYPSPAEFSTVTSSRIIELTNRARVETGLPVLMHSAILDQSALLKARDMIDRNYFAHDCPTDGTRPWEWFKLAGYNYTFAGENLAMNFSEAEEAVDAWLQSPTHKANLMSANYDEIGIAVVVGKINGQETTLVVQHFGKSFVTSPSESLAGGTGEQTPEVLGTTQVSSGKNIEVTFKPVSQRSIAAQFIYYAQKFFLILLIFVGINLLLTIFIRIKIQHKPILLHAVLVIGLGLLALLTHPHFLEAISSGAVSII